MWKQEEAEWGNGEANPEKQQQQMKVLLQQNEAEAEFNSGDECGNIVIACCREIKMEIKQKKM